jgi:hypothetical protein
MQYYARIIKAGFYADNAVFWMFERTNMFKNEHLKKAVDKVLTESFRKRAEMSLKQKAESLKPFCFGEG